MQHGTRTCKTGIHGDAPMSTTSLPRRITAEFLGTLLLVATVVGSGILAKRLAGTNVGLAHSS